jgi:hypothetical protein
MLSLFTIYSGVYYFMLIFQVSMDYYELDYYHVFIMFSFMVHWEIMYQDYLVYYYELDFYHMFIMCFKVYNYLGLLLLLHVTFHVYGSLDYYHMFIICFKVYKLFHVTFSSLLD